MTPKRDPRKIGASDIVALCGLSPYSAPYSVFLRVTGKVGWNKNSSDIADWGHDMEPGILNHFERTRKAKLIRGKTYTDPKLDWAVATPDGVDREYPISVDAKNADWERADELAVGLPDDFKAQGLWQIGVYNAWARKKNLPELKDAVFHVAIAGRPPNSYVVPWDDEAYEKILRIASDFRSNALRGIPPKATATARIKAELADYFGSSPLLKDKSLVPADDEARQVAEILKQLRAWQAEIVESVTFYEARICRKIGDQYGIDLGDGRRIIWPESRGNVKYKDLLRELASRYKIPVSEIEELANKFRGKAFRRLDMRRI